MGNDAMVDAGRTLRELEPRLAELPEDAVQKPHTDPHGAAMTALLVADWLGQEENAAQLAAAGEGAALADDVTRLARGMLALVGQLGGEYLPDAKAIPGDLVHRGQAVRAAAIAELEKSLADDAQAKAWLDAIRRGVGLADLVYDLRTLGVLHARRSDVLPPEAAKVPTSVRAAADAIEYALRAGESHDEAHARGTLARVWTLLVPAYERAATAGRAVTRAAGRERAFPALPLLASHRRARLRPPSIVGSAIGSVPPPSTLAAAPTGGIATPIIMKSEPPPFGSETALPAGRAETLKEARCAIRHLLEIEVSMKLKDARYLGFTENMSTGGVFIATYMAPGAGSKVEIELTMRGGETVLLAGEIRWQRPASSEGWPGIGVKFDEEGPAHDARMNRLLSLRDRIL